MRLRNVKAGFWRNAAYVLSITYLPPPPRGARGGSEEDEGGGQRAEVGAGPEGKGIFRQ
jgi:hypothetical protein